ncbi:MAG TPA: ABC transporter permease [Burkholderiaceae bacterium]|nr:ABC transporter permease [Burkholderiaceae bacterium]
MKARLLGALVLALPLLAALFAPWLFPGDPRDPIGRPFSAPAGLYPLGTDDLGRDLLAALAHGGRASLLTGAVVTAGAALLALLLGVIAGMAGPALDRLIVRLMDLSQIVPRFFLALLATAWLGPGWLQLAVILALTGWASPGRLVRAEARTLRSAAFVEAALLLGASRGSVALRHLLPNMLPLVLPQLPLIFTSALLIEAGLCFIGAGDPNRLSWGLLIQTGQAHALRGWWLALFPGAALALTCVGLTLLAFGRADAAAERGA